MHRILLVMLAVAVATPAAAQIRRPRPAAFPLSVTFSASLNSFSPRASDTTGPSAPQQCAGIAYCVSETLALGPGVGAEIQVPLFGNFGLDVGAEAIHTRKVLCTTGGDCASTTTNVLALRGRAQLLFRLKARAPVYFGGGIAGVRFQQGETTHQTAPTTDMGGMFTIGADFPAGPRVHVRVAWHSYFVKADSTGITNTQQVRPAGRVHDGSLTVGARLSIL